MQLDYICNTQIVLNQSYYRKNKPFLNRIILPIRHKVTQSLFIGSGILESFKLPFKLDT